MSALLGQRQVVESILNGEANIRLTENAKRQASYLHRVTCRPSLCSREDKM